MYMDDIYILLYFITLLIRFFQNTGIWTHEINVYDHKHTQFPFDVWSVKHYYEPVNLECTQASFTHTLYLKNKAFTTSWLCFFLWHFY